MDAIRAEEWSRTDDSDYVMTAWGVRLGDAYISGGSSDTNLDNVSCDNSELTVVGCMTSVPQGLGIPGKRTQDVTYFERDGVRHFNDLYEPRIITISKVMVCGSNCDGSPSCSAREKLRDLLLEWRRSCCDIELVLYTDCNGEFVEGPPILGQQLIRKNLIRNPSFEEDTQFWTVPSDSFCRTYDRCYTEDAGTTWCYSNAIDGSFTESLETDGGWVGNNYFRLTCDIVPTMPGIGFTYAPPFDVNEIDIVPGVTYTSSAYLRASDSMDVVGQILWFDNIGTLLGVTSGSAIDVGNDWTRVDVAGSAPENADHAYAQWATTEVSDWTVGDTIDIDGALFEASEELLDYFDGDTPDIDAPVTPQVGDRIETNLWSGNENLSISLQSSQVYEENIDRSLYGPVGVVGRPRVAEVNWVGRGTTCAEVLLRFDGTDQNMYVLDECGTPGYQQCRTVTPGLVQTCRSYDRCYSGEGRCYSNDSSFSLILPVTLPVRGTERVFPLIVLYPGLSYPTVENMNSGEFVKFNDVVSVEPIQIDTKNGIATGVDSGASYTHLLGGSIFMSMIPGDTQFRMYSNASDDSGYAAICWRDAVVSI